VRTIAWAARAGGREGLTPLLAGLKWSWIPYIHPGIPLALRIQEERTLRPDVLILGNHGLVVAADECEAAEALLHEVEHRLDAAPRPAGIPDLRKLEELSKNTEWEIAEDNETHALATDALSCEIAARGTLFPDQCVYLGPAAAILEKGDGLAGAVQRYQTRYDFAPVLLLVAGAGTLTKREMKRSARELLLGLAQRDRAHSEQRASYVSTWRSGGPAHELGCRKIPHRDGAKTEIKQGWCNRGDEISCTVGARRGRTPYLVRVPRRFR
jgi:rhamnose utilization protein RhaD (predicted bifunctional aldolase and dehydrogenase)